MAADPTKSPTPESPTTARPLEMDDDDVQDANIADDDTATAKPVAPAAATAGEATEAAPPSAAAKDAPAAADEPAPPKPPRPLTEQQKKEQTLKEAFPTVDLAVVKAVLTASRGNIEAAFHALLEMTDPDAAEQDDPLPPPQPPRPVPKDDVPQGGPGAGRLSPNSQMLADEEYARQLAQHYESEAAGGYEARTSSGYGGPPFPPYPPRHRQETDLKPNEMWGDKEHSFLDDDLPVIRESLRKGFVETQSKFNSWVTGIKKKIDEDWIAGDDDDDDANDGHGPQQGQGRTGYGRGGFGAAAGYGRPPPRRSGDYDADPQVLSDDFAGIQLHADGTPVRQNPNVFRPPPSTSPRTSSEHRVKFRDQDETIDMYGASPKLPPKDGQAAAGSAAAATTSSGTKASKWQPLSSVDPAPIADTDPFSLGDSEDEKDAPVSSKADSKPDSGAAAAKTSTSSTSAEDAERLRKAAAEAMADSLVDDTPKK